MQARIDPKTGFLVSADDPDSIFEFFMTGHLPAKAPAKKKRRTVTISSRMIMLGFFKAFIPNECMNRRVSPHTDDSRHLLAQEAARIMAEEGVRDFRFAKRKAAERLGFDPRSLHLPTNLEVEQALAEHQRLFQC